LDLSPLFIELCQSILDQERRRRGTAEPPDSAFTSRDSRAGQSRFGFSVDDIEAFHEHLIAQGVRCLRPPTLEEFGGKLAEYADPDAVPFSVSQTPDRQA
jgi:catechol 2,3-dioxygenase-like lactoylglutathione lyase family enzyme